MIHAGIGHTYVEGFLAALNIPAPHHTTLKKRDGEIANALESAAKRSSNRTLEEEKKPVEAQPLVEVSSDKAAVMDDGGDGEDETTAIGISFNGAW